MLGQRQTLFMSRPRLEFELTPSSIVETFRYRSWYPSTAPFSYPELQDWYFGEQKPKKEVALLRLL